MDYKEKYEYGLECIQEILSGAGDSIKTSILRKRLQPFFPELKENEDEKIRKAILELVRQSSEILEKKNQEQMIDWLEKQGKDKSDFSDLRVWKYIVDMVLTEKDGIGQYLDNPDTERIAKRLQERYGNIEKQGESPRTNIEIPFGAADSELQEVSYYIPEGFYAEIKDDRVVIKKIEPNPKVKDWVILNDTVAQILDKQKYGFVGLDIDGKDFFCNYGHTDSMRLWTIQDARDGDVLVTEDYIFIFKYILHGGVHLYCHYNFDDEEFDADIPDAVIGNIHDKGIHFRPATKEQRDLLFEKMKEAGYEYDSEKKELKKVEPKPLNPDKVIAWLVANISDFEYYVKLFKKDFGL